MSQKNKRNTRRGRAKRWGRRWLCSHCPIYTMRGTGAEVWRGHCSGQWHVDDDPFGPVFASRAAAMRAAEHLARRR